MRSYTRARLLGATALAVAVLMAMAPVAGAATAPPKVQVTVTDDRTNGIRFVVAGVPEVVEPNTYKIELVNNSIGPTCWSPLAGCRTTSPSRSSSRASTRGAAGGGH
jgi:hypothetical protein